VDEVAVVVELRVRQRNAGEGAGGSLTTRGRGPEGAKNPKLSHSGLVLGCFGAAGCREGCSGVVPPPSHNNLTCGGGE
jgi:hypothetical protein